MDTSKYVLERDDGSRFDLTPPASIYLVNVSGLGGASSNTFAALGNGFFMQTQEEEPQENIQGDLVYQAGAYSNYKTLADWLFSAKTLYFCYDPLGVEYRKAVRLRAIGKDRRDSAGWMQATIVFEPLTPWLLPTPTAVGMQVTSGSIKEYAEHSGDYYYTFDADLCYGEELGDFTTQIPATGHGPAGLLFRYHGEIENPVIQLKRASGDIIGKCVIDGTFAAGDTIEISTLQSDCHVYKISGGVVTDLVATGKVDLSFDPYFRAPADEASILTIEGDDEVNGTAELKVYSQWRTV